MDIQDALSLAASGRAVLFVGAGMSTEATNSANARIPTGNELRDLMAKQIGLPSPTPQMARSFFDLKSRTQNNSAKTARLSC